MSWKLIAVALLLLAVSLYGAYRLGGHFATRAAVAQCNTDRANDRRDVQAAQTVAVEKARKAQEQADKLALEQTRRLLWDAAQQGVAAQKTASEAQAKADTLTRELARLKNERPDVKAWNDSCLPPSLLRSLHGAEGAPTGSPCR